MDVRLPDGTIITNVPEGTTQSELMRRVGLATELQKPPVKDAGFSLKDLAASFGIGALGSTKALTDVAGAENIASEALGAGVEGIQRAMTPERQAEMERQAARMKAAEESGSTFEEIKAGALNVAEAPLQSAAQAIGSFVPYLLSTPVAAGMRLAGASKVAIEAVSRQAPKIIATAQGAGAVKGAIYDGVLRAELESGVDPELAKQKADAAQSYFGGNIEQIALGAGLGFVAGSSGVEKFLTPAGRVGAAQNMGRRVGEAVVKETLPEAAQGGQERLAQNIALQREGYDVDTFTGVAGAATQEALTGALGAAPIAALARPEVRPPESVDAFKKEEEEFRKQFGTPEAVQPTDEGVQLTDEGVPPINVDTEPQDAEINAAPQEPSEPPTEFPGGFVATPREISRQEVPEAFGIVPEGADKPLTSVNTQEEAQAKLETLTEIRAEEQARLIKESDKISSDIKAEQRKLDVMEATGQTDTDQYVQSKALFEQQQNEAALKIEDINNQIVAYSAPLTIAPLGGRTEIQREYIVSRGNEPIGAFGSLEEAAATLKNLEPELFKQAEIKARSQEVESRTQKVDELLRPMFTKFNLGDVGLNVVEEIKTQGGGLADGSFSGNLIKIAMDVEKPVQVMRHETVHALKELGFFTPQQYKVLTERAEKQWIKQYLEGSTAEVNGVQMSRLDAYKELAKDRNLTPEQLQEEIAEEAIADAFGAYDRGETPPPGMIAALFKKLKNFFMNFGQALRGAGFESADDVFQRIERGELKSRKPKVEAAPKAEPKSKPEVAPKAEEEDGAEETTEKLSLKTVEDVIKDGVDRLVKTARKGRIKEDQDRMMVGNARADTNLTKVQDGIEKRLMELGVSTKRDERGDRELDTVIYGKVLPAYRAKLKEIEGVRFGEEKFSLKGTEADIKKADNMVRMNEESSKRIENKTFANAFDKAEVAKAKAYEEKNGIAPYLSVGEQYLPTTDGAKYSLKTKDKYGMYEGIPLNKDGTITVYYHTTKADAMSINKSKRISPSVENKVYLTNESSGALVLRKRGLLSQETDGSVVMMKLPPSMMQLAEKYPDGRVDMFIPLAEGDFFDEKMRVSAIQVSKNKAILEKGQTFSYKDYAARISAALTAYGAMSPEKKKQAVKKAAEVLREQHNIGTLLTTNGKLEKTSPEAEGLNDLDVNASSMGLGLASAQKITDKLSSCPNSAICVDLCLGDTAGGNQQYGGVAKEDVGDIEKSAFRAGPRMVQYLKTEALVIHPEEFALVLSDEIQKFKDYERSTTIKQRNPETGKVETVEAEVYEPSIRLNVTSDFAPEMFKPLFDAHPDVFFYDYTKLQGKPIADNHHLTYSSTGFAQMIDGKLVQHKTNNWNAMRGKLNSGYNVAMAFTSKSTLPKTVIDEETGKTYQVWDGDNYDARYLDPKRPDGIGMIVGLRNKAGTMKERESAAQTDGFFVNYDPKVDGDAVTVPNQKVLTERKVIPIAQQKFSLKNVGFPSIKATKEAVKDAGVPKTDEFKRFIAGNQWNDADGKPMMFYHATAREFFEFTPAGQSKAIFLATTPEEAETFGSIAEDNLRREIYEKLLNKEQKIELFQRVVDAEAKKGSITAKQGADFVRQAERKIPKYGDFGDIEQEVYDALLDLSPTRMSIMPLFARSETPFDFEDADQVERVMQWVANNTEYPQDFPDKWLAGMKGRIKQGVWQAIEDKRVQQALRALGHDGFTVREGRGSEKNYAVYTPEQVKSVTGNLGEFGRESKNIKYSLPTIPQQLQDRMGETITVSQRKTVIQNIVDAIRPTSAADFRAKYLNRYNQMSVYDKKRAEQMGGAALLADQSAESAALMSDLGAGIASSAMGFDDRNGGIPVLRNGITTIDKSVKGLIASLAPLAQRGDPAVNQRYQYWAMVKRGQRLNKQGRLTGIDSADVAFAKLLEQKHPEFVSVQKDLIAFNNGLVKYMVDTGVLSKERGVEYTKYADYIPFYRQMDGSETLGPNLFQSLSGVKPPKKLKGAVAEEAPLADFLETMVRNTQSSIQAGIKNYAAQRAINVATQVQAPGMGAQRLNTKENGDDIINVLEKGNLVSYRTPDTLLVNAMMSLNQSELPFMGLLSGPADLLRTLVTKEPGFMMANILRDSMSAWVTSGVKMTPIAGTVINFGKALARKSPGFEAMLDAGIIGGYEFSANVEQSGFKLEKDLARKAGKRTDAVLLRPFKSLWDALETGTTASDAATRALIYERVLADTGNEAEALYRSLEVMNFHRKGSSPLIRVLTAAVPFFNARLQGLDLFYRASTGNMNNKDSAAIQRQFLQRGTYMMALSGLYWFLVSDDEEYKKQEQETKDNNWIIPAIGVKIPIPFEVGVLFKVMPERIAAYLFGNDTGKDLQESIIRSLVNTFAFNPVPQTVKPLLEAYVDFNMFTLRPILGPGMKDIEPEFQVGPSTSNFSKMIAQNLGLSPIKVDHILKGYTGTLGMYAIDTIDMVLDQFGDSPKPTKRFEQLPVIKRFASDPEARGFVTQYYELKDAVDTTVRTMNLLENTGQFESYKDYLVKNQGTLAFKDYINDTEKTMKELREMRTAVRSSTMSGDDKRDALLEISRIESSITSRIQDVKKAIAKVQ